MPRSLAVRLNSLTGGWQTLGTVEARGVWPENVQLAADEKGPTDCSMTLKRDPAVPWGDILAATQIRVEVGGVLVWGGRIGQTPGQDPDTINVTGQGNQFYLDDDQYDGYWIHNNLSAWGDTRNYGVPLINQTGLVSTSQSGAAAAVTIGWQRNDGVSTSQGPGITLDLGPNRLAKRVIIAWDRNGGQADTLQYLRGHDTSNWLAAGQEDIVSGTALSALPASSTYYGGTFTTPRRFVTIALWYTGPGGVFAGDILFRITEARVYVAAGYDGLSQAAPSNLKASDIIRDVLSGANLGGTTKLPKLSQSTDRIASTSFNVLDFFPDGPRTPRELIEAANAFHDYLVGVDAEGRLFFQARPTAPDYQVGKWSGAPFSDASLNSITDLYNKVMVTGAAGDGSPVRRTVTATSGLLTRQGITRTKRLDVAARVTNASADVIGAAWLARKAVGGLRGSASYGPGAIRIVQTGAAAHPAEMLLACGKRLRLAGRSDPITGATGREGVIRSVTYSHDQETCTLQMDNDATSFEALLARLAAVTGG